MERLRQNSYQVWYVAEMEPGIADEVVLNLANQEEAMLLSADKDFGELVFRQERMTTGAVLIRLAGVSPLREVEFVAFALAAHGGEMEEAFTLTTPGAVRFRRRAAKSEKDSTAYSARCSRPAGAVAGGLALPFDCSNWGR